MGRWKVHGTVHLRRIEIILIAILIIVILCFSLIITFKDRVLGKIKEVKDNYTDIHGRVHQLEYLHKGEYLHEGKHK